MPEFDPIQTSQIPRHEKLVQRVWECARAFLCSPTPFFMRRWRRGVTALFASLCGARGKISRSSSISRRCRIDYPWKLKLGDRSSLCDGTWIYALDCITIGKNVCVGEDVKLITGSHDISAVHFDLVTKPITIEDNVWIATGATILPGVTIREGAVVAAGSVVVKDVDPWSVVGGNPARFIKKRELNKENG